MNHLYKSAKSGELAHALVLESADINASLSAALGIAKSLMCCGAAEHFCGECENCEKITKKIHPDVKIICAQEEKTKSVKVDEIRSIRQDAYIIPNEGDYKVYIIADGDYMTVQAQNAFIKILEEPPKNMIFIILCSSFLNLLQTVRSRAQHFILGAETQNTHESDLAKDIAQASIESENFKIMGLTSKIPHDRVFLKKLLNDTMKIFVDKCAEDISSNKKADALLKKIDSLRYIKKIVDKNVNFNLLMCYLCANL